jgi:hypothetical protein
MTCLVFSLAQGRHVHFIDGADGGYALAARQLKAQLQALAAPSPDLVPECRPQGTNQMSWSAPARCRAPDQQPRRSASCDHADPPGPRVDPMPSSARREPGSLGHLRRADVRGECQGQGPLSRRCLAWKSWILWRPICSGWVGLP